MGRPLLITNTTLQQAKDSLKGKTVLITGGNRGIGFEVARHCLSLGATVILACRSPEKARQAIQLLLQQQQESSAASSSSSSPSLNCRAYPLDLSSYRSVRSFVSSLQHDDILVDVVVNNAGAILPRGLTPVDDEDAQWQTNALSPFLLNVLLLRHGRLCTGARIVNVTSFMHYFAGFDARYFERAQRCEQQQAPPYNRMLMYSSTKLMNILLSNALNRRLVQHDIDVAHRLPPHSASAMSSGSRIPPPPPLTCIRSLAVHPGCADSEFMEQLIPRWLHVIASPLLRATVLRTPEECARTVVDAIVKKEWERVGGVYIDNGAVRRESEVAASVAVQEKAWRQAFRDTGLLTMANGSCLDNIADDAVALHLMSN